MSEAAAFWLLPGPPWERGERPMARVVGIIAEYNPFHSGHARQIAHIREEGEARVVAVMSGNFVQRGEAALFDKYVREIGRAHV